MPGSQPGVLGLFTTPAKCLIMIINYIAFVKVFYKKYPAFEKRGINYIKSN